MLWLKKNVHFIDGSLPITGEETLEELAEILTRSSVMKVLGKRREKPLYLMFLMEMLNDPSLEEVFYRFENETLKMISKRVGWELTDENRKQNLFFSRVINGLLIADIIFSKDDVLSSQHERMYNLLYPLIFDALTN